MVKGTPKKPLGKTFGIYNKKTAAKRAEANKSKAPTKAQQNMWDNSKKNLPDYAKPKKAKKK